MQPSKKDHKFLPAIIKMAELKYRNLLYAEALDLAKKLELRYP
jgi:hypothetical protein